MEAGGERNKKIVQFRRVLTALNKQKKEIRYRRKWRQEQIAINTKT